MPVTYREEYIFAGTIFGIEDYKQPGPHFFPERQEYRFKCWVNGCGICTGHDTLREARIHLLGYAIARFKNEISEIMERLVDIEAAVDYINTLQSLMGDDS